MKLSRAALPVLAVGLLYVADTPVGSAAANEQTGLTEIRRKLEAGESVRVVCFGDSVTGVYYHTGSRRAYADLLEIALRRQSRQSQVTVFNAGISGNTTGDGLARIQRDVLSRNPDLVTVMFGLNDMTRVPREEFRANLTAIVAQCRRGGAEVVLATPNSVISTPRRPIDKLVQYCGVIRELGQDLQVPVCDCYRQLEAMRARDAAAWRLLMSDAIHPNMDGHRQIAGALAETISGSRVSDVRPPPPFPAIPHTLSLLHSGQTVRVLAMPPFDTLIGPAIKRLAADARVEVTRWPTRGRTLAGIEREAKSTVRAMKPDLVLLAVPRSASAGTAEAFADSYAWIMNWSLNFGSPTWDCVVIHPAVTDPAGKSADRDALIRQLVHAQDLSLIDRQAGSSAEAATILVEWLRRQQQGSSPSAPEP